MLPLRCCELLGGASDLETSPRILNDRTIGVDTELAVDLPLLHLSRRIGCMALALTMDVDTISADVTVGAASGCGGCMPWAHIRPILPVDKDLPTAPVVKNGVWRPPRHDKV